MELPLTTDPIPADPPFADHDIPPRKPRRWLIYLLIALGLIAAALLGRWLAQAGAAKNARSGRPATAVAVAKVESADMPVTLSAVGTVTPVDTAIVRTQLAGNVFAILFKEGQQVRSGQVIAQIDPRPYRIALQQAEGNLARDAAQLTVARQDLVRYQTLLRQDSIARQQVDTQVGLVKQLEGTVAADRATIGSAHLNLDYTAVKAPVTGQIGLRQVTIGNYVTPGDTSGIAVVTRTDPIDVTFSLPQADIAAIRRKAAAGGSGNSPDSAGGLPVSALDQDNTTVLAQGKFLTFDNQVDTTTGTVKAKARFANPVPTGGVSALFANQFVNVRMLVDTLKGAAVVPVSAVRHGAPGDFVFVVQPDQTVKLTVVRIGPSDGARVAVTSGLRPGQTVVSEGADGLDDGSKVRLPGGGGGNSGQGGAAGGTTGTGKHHRQQTAQ
jgi:multidrug efflux system membrane fusion protein